MQTCFIGLGSNLNSPIEQLDRALTAITRLENTCVVQVSAYFQTEAMTSQDDETNCESPDYINAVAEIITGLTAQELLKELQKIENSQGRKREKDNRWISRTLDLDILLYGNEIIQSDTLQVPHYDMKNRNFVLIPLLEIAPAIKMPNGEAVKDFVGDVRPGKIRKL